VDAVNRRLNASSGGLSTQARAAWIRLVVERAAVTRTQPACFASTGLLMAWAACAFPPARARPFDARRRLNRTGCTRAALELASLWQLAGAKPYPGAVPRVAPADW